MIRLLRANFSRMFRSWYFRLGMLISIVLNIYLPVVNYINMQTHSDWYNLEDSDPEAQMEFLRSINCHESYMFIGGMFCMFIVPVIIALFIGTDYSDGTIRNKLMVGHRRCDIYLANLITAVSSAELVLLSGMAVSYLTGLIFFKYTYLSAVEILVFILVGIFITASISAICTFLAMIIPSKAGGMTASIMTSFVLMISGGSIGSALESPRYYDDGVYEHTDTGEIYEFDNLLDEMSLKELHEYGLTASDIDKLEPMRTENPYYPKGLKRKIYVWIQEATPGCQYMSLQSWNKDFNDTSFAWSAFFIVVTTATGILMFRKRNLK